MMKQAIIGLQGGRTRHSHRVQGPEVNTHSPPPTVFVSSTFIVVINTLTTVGDADQCYYTIPLKKQLQCMTCSDSGGVQFMSPRW